MFEKEIQGITSRLRNDIGEHAGSLLEKFPVDTYLAMLERYPEVFDYHFISREASQYTGNILHHSDPHTLELYYQLVPVELISRNIPN